MESNRYSLYKLDKESISLFNTSQYSLLKFGHKESISNMGSQLFDLIVKLNKSSAIDLDNSIILIGPYQYIDTASSLLTKETIKLLNLFSEKSSSFKRILYDKIGRKTTYFTDYALMSKEDRYNLIKNDSFYINYQNVGNKDIIIVDDIRISGTHEDIMYNLFKEGGFKNKVNFIFLAEIEPNSFEPSIEHYLNSFIIKTANDLIPYILEDSIHFTTRGVKMIFSMPANEFLDFIEIIPIKKQIELYDLAIGNEYDKVELTAININALHNKLNILTPKS